MHMLLDFPQQSGESNLVVVLEGYMKDFGGKESMKARLHFVRGGFLGLMSLNDA